MADTPFEFQGKHYRIQRKLILTYPPSLHVDKYIFISSILQMNPQILIYSYLKNSAFHCAHSCLTWVNFIWLDLVNLPNIYELTPKIMCVMEDEYTKV